MKRTAYQQSLMDSTYQGVAIEAIKNGWDGAWERLIAQRLRIDYRSGHSEAIEIIDSLTPKISINPDVSFRNASIKAAYLITSSTIQEHEKSV